MQPTARLGYELSALGMLTDTANGGLVMTVGGSLFLIAVGAILKFALTTTVVGIDLQVVGVILMVVGAVGLVLGLILWGTQTRKS